MTRFITANQPSAFCTAENETRNTSTVPANVRTAGAAAADATPTAVTPAAVPLSWPSTPAVSAVMLILTSSDMRILPVDRFGRRCYAISMGDLIYITLLIAQAVFLAAGVVVGVLCCVEFLRSK